MRILLGSADLPVRDALQQLLLRHHFIVDVTMAGEEAWELLQAFMYDVVLLEGTLLRPDGLVLCDRLRNIGNPVLILLLTEPADVDTRIQGLNHGADACLSKPIQESELLAQLATLARRGSRRATPLLTWGPLVLNLASHQITCHDQVLKLNRKEYQILELFLSSPQKMFPRSEIGNLMWTLDDQFPTDGTIKSHIRSIRRKLEQAGIQNFIQTHYGQGYCLNPSCETALKSLDAASHPPGLMMDSITANLWQELMTANARLHQEIEQRKQVEVHLRRSELMLRNAQRVALVGCWEFDITTRETYWTEEMFILHGLDPNRQTPTPEEILTLIHPDDRQLHETMVHAPALRREAFEANLRIIRVNDGEIRYINARGGPLHDSSGKMIKLTGTTADVTQWLQ
jgi:DNA-binding response OmpR family regulator